MLKKYKLFWPIVLFGVVGIGALIKGVNSQGSVVDVEDSILDVICDKYYSRGTYRYVLCESNNPIFFYSSHSELSEDMEKLQEFIVPKTTIIAKQSNSPLLKFINQKDTMYVFFKIKKHDGALFDGEIVRPK